MDDRFRIELPETKGYEFPPASQAARKQLVKSFDKIKGKLTDDEASELFDAISEHGDKSFVAGFWHGREVEPTL